MKKATALKSFTDSGSGRRLRKGDEIRGSDTRILELKTSGLVEDVKDVTDEENALEGEALSRAMLTGAVLDEGTGARVSIGFASAAHANHFREHFAKAIEAALESAPPAPRPAREPRQTKPAAPRQTKPAPEPKTGQSVDPGSGEGTGGPGAGELEKVEGQGDQTGGEGGEGGAETTVVEPVVEPVVDATVTAPAGAAEPPAARRPRGNKPAA